MASTNGSGRPSGCISIPVEIIRDSNSSNSASPRHHSPYRTVHTDNPYGAFSDSPPRNPSMNPTSNARFQPRQSPNNAYDRVIQNSQFNQPLNDRPSFQHVQDPLYRQPQAQQRMYDPGLTNFSHSNEDLLSSPFDSMRYSAQPPYSSLIPPSFSGTTFRPESDFVQSSKYTSPLRRSFDALNDFPDMYQSFPMSRPYQFDQPQQQPQYRSNYQTQHQPRPQQQQQANYANQNHASPNIVYTNEYGVPTDRYQPNTFHDTGHVSDERARSPASQRGPSPARPSPATQRGPSPARPSPSPQQQQQQTQDEPELKMAKDSDGPIPMPAPASLFSQSPDQQVPSPDTSATTNPTASAVPPPPPAASEPVRDPNTIALDKLEQIKQALAELNQEVDHFTGSSRNEHAYKVLDEKALKIMIRCDELVDVSADIREKRKEMIRNVDKVIAKLESKVPATPAVDGNSNPMETSPSHDDVGGTTNEQQETNNKISSPSSSPSAETLDTEPLLT